MVSLRFLLLIVALVLLIVRAMVLLSSYAITCNIHYVQYTLRAIYITCNIDCVQYRLRAIAQILKKQGLAASFTSLSQYWIVIK